jgi:OOP family OmpA-OmpF porin
MSAPSIPDGLDELRNLLVAPEREAIEELRARLEDPAFGTRHLARALPEALARSGDDRRLSEALQPPVEAAITASVRRNPRPLADALFPVMGPAIRKAIAHTLSGMLESMNRTLEHSVSLRALQWRLTAWRTGKSFGEIVLLNTLVYRVEQVFLIHAQTGLLLHHVTAEAVSTQDADMVSGMLTAIRDFARDSFGGRADDTLDTFRVGELSGIIEQGPHAYLAAVVRGARPPDLRHALQRALETIHLQQAADFDAFNGDAARFDDVRPVLLECLEAQYRGADAPASRRRWGVAAVAVLLLLLGWLGYRWLQQRRFDAYLAALRAEPGVVVVDARREGRGFLVSGMRDPLAIDPVTLVAASGLPPERVSHRWQLYQALDPRLTVRRAVTLLQPPEGVAFSLQDGTLSATGEASTAWIREASLLARTLPGVARFDPSRLQNAELRAASRRIEALMMQFVRGTADLAPGQDQALRAMVGELRLLDQQAREQNVRFRVVMTGHTDADGPPERNLVLSRERAAAIVAAVPRDQLPALEFTSHGAGSAEPIASGTTEADKQRNRRVAVRVEPLAGGS